MIATASISAEKPKFKTAAIQESRKAHKPNQPLELIPLNLIRDDVYLHGQIRPETRTRLWDEETTRFAEMIHGPVNTSFDFSRSSDGRFLSESGNDIEEMLENCLADVQGKSKHDARYKDIEAIRKLERDELDLVRKNIEMLDQPKEILVFSPYPEDLETKHGRDFMIENGFDPNRRLSFIRLYKPDNRGGYSLKTVSIDNSDLTLWSQLLGRKYNSSLELLSDCRTEEPGSSSLAQLVKSYDNLLSTNGRQSVQGIFHDRIVNTWDFVKNQPDILNNYYFKGLEEIALAGYSSEEELSRTRLLMAETCSVLRRRYETPGNDSSYASLSQEVSHAMSSSSAKGESFIYCGGSFNITTTNAADSEYGILSNVFQASNILKCVTCPYCKDTVDAKVTSTTIECLSNSCGTKIDKRSGKVLKSKREGLGRTETFQSIIEKLLQEIFGS